MDQNIDKIENDCSTNTKISIKTEPVDDSSKFLTETSVDTTESNHNDVNTNIFENDINSGEFIEGTEVVCHVLYVNNRWRDLKNISDQSSSKDVGIKEEGGTELFAKGHFLDVSCEKSEENGELSIKKKKFICYYCGKDFDKKSPFKIHLQIHTGYKPFKCEICERKFNRKAHLINHRFTHTDEKPHRCDTCNKSFDTKQHLERHKLIHTGNKPYLCDQCDQRFTQKGNLVTHKLIHLGEKPFKCDVCEKAFNNNSNLVKHKRIHLGQKPYKCDVCEKLFTEKSNLAKHRLIHMGVKTYLCNICTKSFQTAYHLTRHKQKIHKNLESEGAVSIALVSKSIKPEFVDSSLLDKKL